MKMNIVNLNNIISLNDMPEVTNPVAFDFNGYPTDDGLLSYTKFGLSGSYDRKTIFGYIDLKKNFLHPVAYKTLTALNKKFVKVINGTGYFSIDKDGNLVEDEENGNTGIDWLYNNFDKLEFRKNDSMIRGNRISLLEKLRRDELFVNKWLVIPAFYRDVNISKSSSGVKSMDEVNKLYTKLLGLANSQNSDFDFMGNVTEFKIQQLLLDIYSLFISDNYLASKSGVIKRDLMGKTIDYSTRGVITAARINSQTWDKQFVPFGYVGLPLSHLCNLFFPFFMFQMRNFFEELFTTVTEIQTPRGPAKLIDPMENFTQDKLKAMLSLYIKSPENRFDPIWVNTSLGKMKANLFSKDLKRPFTVMDLMFIVAQKVCEDKHVYVTRYPIETFQSIYPCKIKILTTYKTQPLTVNNTYMDNYPVLDLKDGYDPSSKFIDSIVPNNTFLQALGADFDGSRNLLGHIA